MSPERLSESLLAAGLPSGFAICSDRSVSWPADWTPEQIATAQAVVDSFDWSDAAQQQWEIQQRRREVLRLLMSNEPTMLGIRALGMVAFAGITEAKQGSTTTKTWAECLAAFREVILSGVAEMPQTLIVSGDTTPPVAGTYLPLEALGQWGCTERGAYISCPGGTWLITTNAGGLFIGPLQQLGPLGQYNGSGESIGNLEVRVA